LDSMACCCRMARAGTFTAVSLLSPPQTLIPELSDRLEIRGPCMHASGTMKTCNGIYLELFGIQYTGHYPAGSVHPSVSGMRLVGIGIPERHSRAVFQTAFPSSIHEGRSQAAFPRGFPERRSRAAFPSGVPCGIPEGRSKRHSRGPFPSGIPERHSRAAFPRGVPSGIPERHSRGVFPSGVPERRSKRHSRAAFLSGVPSGIPERHSRAAFPRGVPSGIPEVCSRAAFPSGIPEGHSRAAVKHFVTWFLKKCYTNKVIIIIIIIIIHPSVSLGNILYQRRTHARFAAFCP